jgi:glycosyltransferase involved in cell wall biosynthesis
MPSLTPKKILFLVTQSEMGGAQRYVLEMARFVNKQGFEVLVAAGSGDGELFKRVANLGIRLNKLKQLKRTPWPWQVVLACREMYDLLEKEKPDVLFLCSTTAGLLGSIAGFLHKTNEHKLRIIYRIGGWAFRDPRPFFLNWLILLSEKLTARFKDKFIVNSEIDRKLALKHKIAPSRKIIKIYNGLDINSLKFIPKEKAKKQFLFNEKTAIVGCVANFYKTKGLKYLIKAMKEVDAKLVIMGDGRLRPQLEKNIRKLKFQNKVILLGKVPNAYQYLKAFDVFVLPSLKEGFPWIILEAMAAEIPIIATKVGAVPEIIENGKEGILVETKNSRVLAEKINWVLNNKPKAKTITKRAKIKLTKEFTSLKMAEKTLATLL